MKTKKMKKFKIQKFDIAEGDIISYGAFVGVLAYIETLDEWIVYFYDKRKTLILSDGLAKKLKLIGNRFA
jgi:hypothetical protein